MSTFVHWCAYYFNIQRRLLKIQNQSKITLTSYYCVILNVFVDTQKKVSNKTSILGINNT